jgi:formate hydrogenlyase subunit 6/NADH:ubiquinone oxidoreductase subunit I
MAASSVPYPIIDPAKCTGCGLCVAICPTYALDQVDGKAALRYAERCTYCTICEDICPENAIVLPFLIVLAKPHMAQGPGQENR